MNLKKNIPDPRPGDTVRVWEKIEEKGKERIQIFEGVVIARKHGQGLNASFTVRKIAVGNIGVEKVFPLHSPLIIKLERLKSSKVRQAKINYVRGYRNIKSALKHEKKSYKVWEDKESKEELEKIEEEQAKQAKLAEKEKEENENKPSGDGKERGKDSDRVSEKEGTEDSQDKS